jgi:hypothetical protein
MTVLASTLARVQPSRRTACPELPAADLALVELGRALRERGYRFTTITPDSHRRVNDRPGNAVAVDLAGVFGWNRPFRASTLPPDLMRLMEEGGVLDSHDLLLKSAVRFSTVADQVLMHSAFPTTSRDAVFLGPDTYRFVRAVRAAVPAAGSLIDLGTGTGAGALSLAGRVQRLVMTDLNPLAVRFARINARIAGLDDSGIEEGDLFAGHRETFDAVIANPPYLVDAAKRLYRDGGGHDGLELALRIVRESIPRLSPRGQLVLYTGVPVSGGRDRFEEQAIPLLEDAGLPYSYQELEADVFGEELSRGEYAHTDRLAVVVLRAGPALLAGSDAAGAPEPPGVIEEAP